MQSISIKKIFIYIFLLCFLFYTESSCHKQRTHQYIVREAYQLLKKYLGDRDVNYLKDKIGTIQTGQYINVWPDNGVPWSDGKVVAGAFREDEEDVVYKYGSDALTYPTRIAWSSVTHFWQADYGDNALTNIDWGGTDIPNAYQKIMLYANGGWDLDMDLILYGFPTQANGSGSCATQRAIVTFHYNSLKDLYFNKQLFVTKVTWLTGQATIYNQPILFSKNRYSLLNSLTYENFMDAIPFEILGRMCHLLGDMSVSAHVHNKSHSGYLGDDTDRYEDWMGGSTNDEWLSENSAATYWNATRVWDTFGNIMNPYVVYDAPLHHLMYTMNQITGHFACDDRYGDDNFNSSNPEIINYFPYGILPNTPSQYNSIPAGDFTSMRDATFPHVIRATAGLLYWFAKEADLLPTPLTYVYLSGTYDLYLNQTGYWYTQLGNGLEPFTYNWEIMYLTGGSYLSSSLKVPIGPRLPEPGYWLHVGTNSSTFSRLNNGADLRNFKLRCTVTDGSNTTKVSNEWTVSVYSTSPPQTSIVSNDGDNAVMMKKNEVEVKSVPKEFSLDQNYPNPFNPTTRISYSLPEANFVTLKIYDMLGSEVVTLVNENKSAGKFEVEFDASKLSSGTYVYKLVAGNYQITKKMQFVK